MDLAGFSPSAAEFTLEEDRAIDVRLVLSEAGPEPAPVPGATVPPPTRAPLEHPAPRGGGVRTRTWVLLGGGSGLLGAAAGFEAARASAEEEARQEPIQVDARHAVDRMRRHESTARTFAIVGAVFTVVGGASLVFDLGSPRRDHAEVAPTGGCGVDGCWVAAKGRF